MLKNYKLAIIYVLVYLKILFRSYQVRGHLAAQIDPLGLNNMNPEQAKKMIIRSVTVDEKVGEHNSFRNAFHNIYVQNTCKLFTSS